jgi:hypothetical protein
VTAVLPRAEMNRIQIQWPVVPDFPVRLARRSSRKAVDQRAGLSPEAWPLTLNCADPALSFS